MSPRSAQFSGITSIDENEAFPYSSYDHARSLSSTVVNTESSAVEPDDHPYELQRSAATFENQSIMSGSQRSASSIRGTKILSATSHLTFATC